MRRRDRGLRHHALIGLGWLLANQASAHGPAPAALEVVAGDDVPIVVRTSAGLATANGDGTYAYVCPARWDGNELARAVASPDGATILVHSAGIAYRSNDGGCTFEALTGEGLYVTAAARWGDEFALVAEDHPIDLDAERSHLIRVTADGLRAMAFDGAIDGVRAEGDGLWIAGHEPAPFVGRLGATWAPIALPTLLPRRWTPRAIDGDAVWLAAQESGRTRLVRVDADGAIEESDAATVAHGPVLLDGRWIAVFDGALHTHDANGWTADRDVPWTCLQQLGSHVAACSLPVLLALSGTDATPLFSVDQLAPPRACGDDAAQRACATDWAHFGGESGWLDSLAARTPLGRRTPTGAEVDAPPREAPARAGCGIAAGAPDRWHVAFAIAAWLGRKVTRRWRSRPSKRQPPPLARVRAPHR